MMLSGGDMKKPFSVVAPFVALLCSLVIFSGCSSPYSPAPQILPSHIKKIYVRPFVNATTQYGLEEKLTLRVIDEFIRDGRLALANKEEDADGVVVGEIK